MWVVACALFVASPGEATVDLEQTLTRHTQDRYTGDLDTIRSQKVLRVLTRNNSSDYFVSRGLELGFAYELSKMFADELGVRLAVVVPPSRDALVGELVAGSGDLVAAGMTISEDRTATVTFSPPVYEAARFVVVHRKNPKKLASVADLGDLELHVDPRSTTYAKVKELERQLGRPLKLVEVSGDIEMEEMLRRVGRREWEATIADEHLLRLERASGVPVEGRLKLGEPLPKGWAMRKDSPKLHAAVADFLARKRRDGTLRILAKKYFEPDTRFSRRGRDLEMRADAEGKISPYDHLFKKYGKKHRIDWRLLAALAMTESKFDPKARSGFGACGLMQIVPRTAREVGKLPGTDEDIARRLLDPETNVALGTKYLRWLMERFDDEGLEERQVIRFALAAYNTGLGHIHDARALAKEIGKDHRRWFKNVEAAMLLKADRKWHEKTRYGYCQGGQPVAYVSQIQSRYDVYVRHVPF